MTDRQPMSVEQTKQALWAALKQCRLNYERCRSRRAIQENPMSVEQLVGEIDAALGHDDIMSEPRALLKRLRVRLIAGEFAVRAESAPVEQLTHDQWYAMPTHERYLEYLRVSTELATLRAPVDHVVTDAELLALDQLLRVQEAYLSTSPMKNQGVTALRVQALKKAIATLRAPVEQEKEKDDARSDQPQPGSCDADPRGDDRDGSRCRVCGTAIHFGDLCDGCPAGFDSGADKHG